MPNTLEQEAALTLRKAYEAADAAAPSQQSEASYKWLRSILFDLYCHFSEEGTTSEQDERLRVMGAPMLQNKLLTAIPDCPDCGCQH